MKYIYIYIVCYIKHYVKHFEISLVLRGDTSHMIMSIEFETNLKMYMDVARYPLRAYY